MVHRALQLAEIESVRFDSHVSSRDRKTALRRLSDDPQVRMMLITTPYDVSRHDINTVLLVII